MYPVRIRSIAISRFIFGSGSDPTAPLHSLPGPFSWPAPIPGAAVLQIRWKSKRRPPPPDTTRPPHFVSAALLSVSEVRFIPPPSLFTHSLSRRATIPVFRIVISCPTRFTYPLFKSNPRRQNPRLPPSLFLYRRIRVLELVKERLSSSWTTIPLFGSTLGFSPQSRK